MENWCLILTKPFFKLAWQILRLDISLVPMALIAVANKNANSRFRFPCLRWARLQFLYKDKWSPVTFPVRESPSIHMLEVTLNGLIVVLCLGAWQECSWLLLILVNVYSGIKFIKTWQGSMTRAYLFQQKPIWGTWCELPILSGCCFFSVFLFFSPHAINITFFISSAWPASFKFKLKLVSWLRGCTATGGWRHEKPLLR